ncbi:hypothetical protein MHK_005715 [Candidatus Magnetomorum sp. HK-1]|nr:hypothetical protein MHK_005715 [Candidatus Magnetomorum sp. HK-1]
MKKSFIILILISFLFTNDCILAQQNIVPTIKSYNQSNIEWSSSDSWIENRIPNENDIVQVNGDLLLDKSYTIKSLIINQESSIKNKSDLKPTLTINGDISNYGTISEISDGIFYLEVAGNIINDGEWENSETKLIGSEAQIIESKNPIGGTLELNGKVITINSPNIVRCKNVKGTVTLNGTGTLYIEGNTSSGTISGTIPEINFSGTNQSLSATISIPKVIFSGSSLIYSSLSINGNTIIKENAVIKNISDRKPTLTVNGNIFNSGSIDDNTSGCLYLIVSGNITNDGEWKNDSTSIIWDSVEMADNYELYTSNSILTWRTDPIIEKTTSYDISSMLYDTIYWKVRASINNNLTDFSDIKSINAQKIHEFKTMIAIGEYELSLPNALITISELDIKTSTDKYGNFSIVDISNGNYKIDIQADGLESIESNIQISDYQAEISNVVIKLPEWLENIIVKNVINSFDVDSDAKIGIKEAIHALKCVVGIKN